tara:strand:- start:827 stop:1045 length:219 start_codon:yes stop_codon:yes gene_type:complete
MKRAKRLLIAAVKEAGSQSKLADILGISQQGVSYIINHAETVSAEIAVRIDKFTNGKIKKADLRPDIFGDAA